MAPTHKHTRSGQCSLKGLWTEGILDKLVSNMLLPHTEPQSCSQKLFSCYQTGDTFFNSFQHMLTKMFIGHRCEVLSFIPVMLEKAFKHLFQDLKEDMKLEIYL